MNFAEAERLIAFVEKLTRHRDGFRAAALCGSWARGNPRSDSDLDFLLIAKHSECLRRNQNWLRSLDFSDAGFRCVGHVTARYGIVWSAHIDLLPVAELELTFADQSWASIDPLDPGTKRVVSDAFRIILDKDGHLQQLRSACV
jgi:uncharacterized protein